MKRYVNSFINSIAFCHILLLILSKEYNIYNKQKGVKMYEFNEDEIINKQMQKLINS